MPLQVLDGQPWTYYRHDDTVRIGEIFATRHQWIEALRAIGPLCPDCGDPLTPPRDGVRRCPECDYAETDAPSGGGGGRSDA